MLDCEKFGSITTTSGEPGMLGPLLLAPLRLAPLPPSRNCTASKDSSGTSLRQSSACTCESMYLTLQVGQRTCVSGTFATSANVVMHEVWNTSPQANAYGSCNRAQLINV